MKEPAMTDAAKIAERYIDLWNETDGHNRKTLIASGWTEDALYVDPMMKGQGHAEIDALIGAVHDRFPGHRFQLDGTPEGHGDRLRFSWTLGAPNAAPIAHGTDFGIVAADGRLKSVSGFLDAAKG
jgi:SnoaL-like domain